MTERGRSHRDGAVHAVRSMTVVDGHAAGTFLCGRKLNSRRGKWFPTDEAVTCERCERNAPLPVDDNTRRRYRASAVLMYYRRRFAQREPLDAVSIDLVADLMHYMNSPEFAHSWVHAKTWDDVARIAEGHYAHEIADVDVPRAPKKIVIRGRMFELVRHAARGAGGMAWSAYEEGQDEPFRHLQARRRWELVSKLAAAVEVDTKAAGSTT